MRQQIKMEEIARLAGVSTSTVSRVLNNKDRVHPDTRAKIKTLINELGYQPCVSAQSLVAQRTNNIMLLIPNITDYYYPKMLEYVTSLCRGRGRRILMGVSNHDPAIEAEFLSQARQGTVDGLIVTTLQSASNVDKFIDMAWHEFPVVHLDCDCLNLKMNTVKYDDIAAGEMAAEYLLEKGHRRIVFCGCWGGFSTVRDRRQGVINVLLRNGIAFNVEDASIYGVSGLDNWDWDRLFKMLNSESAPTALVTENDIMAISFIRKLTSQGLKVPEDVAVMGFGDSYSPHMIEKKLTTVSLPLKESCQQAVDILISEIESASEEKKEPEYRVLAPTLVVGDTA